MWVQELVSRLNDVNIPCGSVLIFDIRRMSCRLPYRCCVTARMASELNEHGSPLSRADPSSRGEPSTRETNLTESDDPMPLMEALVTWQKRQRDAEKAAHEAEEEAEEVRAETEAAKRASLRASEHMSSMLKKRSIANEKALKLREAADRLAPPKSD